MLQPKRFRWALALTLVGTSLLSACIVIPAGGRHRHGGYYADADGGGPAAVVVAAPAPQIEVVGVSPGPGYFWIGGSWGHNGGRREWVPGRWSRR